ncbi:gluconolactonase [Planoprotostelium fungivorum]|uniref:Gluconolactonase n=1 Tax=Planoprotostelium fungivorum TaxID=1890364 RepID=A0A2P6NTM8_9EUKA|nr:gluconolactonase [Planoprotostelium fungivorum]
MHHLSVFCYLLLTFASSLGANQTLKSVATYKEWPTGIAVSSEGRIFTSFPRQRQVQPYTLAELVGGSSKPYPSVSIQSGSYLDASSWFVDAQSVVIDSEDRLWVLDTGFPFKNGTKQSKAVYNGPKIVCIDLKVNKVVRTYVIPAGALVEKSSINDVRFNLTLGDLGYAFISDTAEEGAIITLDLNTGLAIRRLSNSSFTRADDKFVGSYENVPFYVREKGKPAKSISNGANAIALYGGSVFFSPQASTRFHSVPQEVLIDQNQTEENVRAATRLVTRTPGYSTGAESDESGRIYYGSPEQNAINYIDAATDEVKVLVSSPLLKWPDSFCQSRDGYLYVTSNDLPKWPKFNEGRELRKPPYHLYKIKTGSRPPM